MKAAIHVQGKNPSTHVTPPVPPGALLLKTTAFRGCLAGKGEEVLRDVGEDLWGHVSHY